MEILGNQKLSLSNFHRNIVKKELVTLSSKENNLEHIKRGSEC